MYQQASHAFLRAEWYASHSRIPSTSDEFLCEHWSVTTPRQAVLRMSKKGKRPRSPSPRRVQHCMAMPELLCYMQLTGHGPTRRSAGIPHLAGSP